MKKVDESKKNLVNIGMVAEFRKRLDMSYEEFIKGLHTFSNGECSMSLNQIKRLESGNTKTHVNAYTLSWIFRFMKIEPNKFFNF